MQINTAGCNYTAAGFKQKFLINARKTPSLEDLSRISAHVNSLTVFLRALKMHKSDQTARLKFKITYY